MIKLLVKIQPCQPIVAYVFQWLVCFSDRATFAKNLRKSDKKVRELSLQVEEERRHADQYKEQVITSR